jgi:hypothetical protein
MKSTGRLVAKWLAGFVLLLSTAMALVLLWPSPLMPGLACDAAADGHVLTTTDFSQIPPQVLEDARSVAALYYPNNADKAEDMSNQLVGTYLAAANKDFVIIFNPGGWGWDPTSDIPGWESILRGMENTLANYGFTSLLVDYKRTRHGFNGIVGEMEQLIGIQPAKTRELAIRVNFLTQHLSNLRVILTGESNGAAVADDTMRLLRNNPRVFCVETGPPVWHPSLDFERSLIIKNNGVQADTFTTGDIVLIIRSNAESAFGIYRGAKGDILLYIGAPGHYYSWDYPAVRKQVVDFLSNMFAPAS